MARIAYQLFSAREEAERDFESVLKTLSDLGYEGVEFAGFYGLGADAVWALLEKHRLEPVSSHVPFSAIEKDMFGVIAYHLAIGCPRIAVPYLEEKDRPGQPGFAHVISVIHRFARLCRDAGIDLMYHNHDFEFQKLSGMYALDFLYAAVPESLLATEIDTCWVKYAGEDPAQYVRAYAGRCPVVHMKDYLCPDEPGAPGGPRPASFEFRPLGKGCQDIPMVVGAAVESGAMWLVVEQDMPLQSPMEDARVSIEALRAIEGL